MKIIGITGGVGSGKSAVLKYLEDAYGAVVCEADLVAKHLQRKGTICYRQMVEHFGEEILLENGRIDREKLAGIVFSDEHELQALNAIVHPAVKEKILKTIREEEKKGTKLFVMEAALLLEEHYDEICDETWYIYARDEVRMQRLHLSRGYSKEKTESMIHAQKTMDQFMEGCDRAIDNSGEFEETCIQIDDMMKTISE